METESKYWLSLEQWREDPKFHQLAEKEFLSTPLSEEGQGEWARREFLKLMGASLALSAFGCVRRPAQKIVPYVNRPEEVVPGVANFYSSCFTDGMEGLGLVVQTREGRPIKVEGLREHPASKGGLSARAQAHVLSLYDPDRLKDPQHNLFNEQRTNRDTIRAKYEDVDKDLSSLLRKGKAALLTPTLNSPSTKSLVREFSQRLNVKHYIWEPLSQPWLRRAQRLCYGQNVLPRFRIARARLIVSLGADFLGTYLAPVEMTKQYAKGRKPGGSMNRLVVFEGLMSLTGANADERKQVKPSFYIDVVMALLYELLIEQKRQSVSSSFQRILEAYKDRRDKLGIDSSFFKDLSKELWKNRGRSLIMAGDGGEPKANVALQVAVNYLNSVLKNDGRTIDYERTPYQGARGSSQDLYKLAESLEKGQVRTLIIHGLNPVYASPQSLLFEKLLKKAERVVYTGDRLDETGRFSDYVLPDLHSMENWGDMETQKGLYSLQQPTLRPLYPLRSFQENLINWAQKAGVKQGLLGTAKNWYGYLRGYWRWGLYKGAPSSFDKFWDRLLEKGYWDSVGASQRNRSSSAREFRTSALSRLKAPVHKKTGYELVLYPTVGLGDGTLANVSWLQEFPDPVTKICWDNYLSISSEIAQKRKLKEGQVVKLAVRDSTLEVPIHIQPGQSPHVLGLALGYGRQYAGAVASGVGINGFKLAQVDKGDISLCGLEASFQNTQKYVKLANVQGHHSMEGRQIIIETTLKKYKKGAPYYHGHKIFSLWKEHKYEGHKWGMAIDLNSCTGCSACVVACQSENNVPVVGKKYVLQGREMHWLRLDRYHRGDPKDPDTAFMPILCQHCENAPCETVCPVMATVHSDEGTNDMIYNRCVGTRFCANNCPYKVRRFNWFDYTKRKDPLPMQLNPEVTVRSRGVMEKCTFCIHRVQQAKEKSKQKARPLKDGDVKTACQQSCPADAIVFGDLNDPQSKVSQAFKDSRSYHLLEELNAKPSVSFQLKVRNTDKLKGSSKKEGDHHG